jgi:hypothetical protein
VTPTYFGCLLASFLFLDNQNDLFVGNIVPSFVRPFVGRILQKAGGILGAQVTQSTLLTMKRGGLQGRPLCNFDPYLRSVWSKIRI